MTYDDQFDQLLLRVRRVSSISTTPAMPADKSPGPEQQAVHRDLLSRAYALMDSDVRRMADFRAGGTEWEEIATRLGGTAEARRKQFTRAMDEIARTLEIE